MASFKLNVAQIQGCPPVEKLAELVAAWGLPESEEYGVLNHSATEKTVFGTIVRKVQQAVTTLDEETGEVTSSAVEKVNVYPFGIRPDTERLEVYAGAANSIEHVGLFFASCLALPTVTEAIEVDIPAAVRKLAEQTQKFHLRTIRVSDYAHNAYMAGTYAPKFLDTQHGLDFLDEYADFTTSAGVRFQAQAGRASVTLSQTASFGLACKEDDEAYVKSLLRNLV